VFNAPQPRSRLYTSASDYAKGALATVAGIAFAGSGTANFERRLGELFPGRCVIAVPMARVGIYLTLKHAIKAGQKVILSPYTISDVVNMVLCAGGVPLFADIEDDGSCNIDANAVAELLNAHQNVGAVLVTHFYGMMCNITAILELCRRKGIPLVEDAAQCFGGKLNGQRAGTIGDAGVFSFGLLKNVTGFFGGAVLTKDAGLEDKIRTDLLQWSVLPRSVFLKRMITGAVFDLTTQPMFFDTMIYWLFRYAYLHDIEFFNNKLDTDSNPSAYLSFPDKYAHRMSAIQADLICNQLDAFEKDTAERIAKASIYHEGLRDLPSLVLPPPRTDGSHIYMHFPIQCEHRDDLGRALTRKMRDVQIGHHRNCASLPCFAAYFRNCPNAERASRSVICLPTYPSYREDQVRANIEAIREYFREANLRRNRSGGVT
jgi:dTDP-4-amino-4,6-dideoxygalactose transaminase